MLLRKPVFYVLLLGCSAITPAFAAEWDLSLGGYGFDMESWFGPSANPLTPDVDGFAAPLDEELRFRPQITLDNGLTFGAGVDVEGPGNSLDEPDIFLRGSFGQVLIGAEGDYAPVPNVSGFAACGTRDGTRTTYFTPRFAGFQLGTSYVTEANGNRTRGALATEVGGTAFNPAFEFGYDLSGVQIGLGSAFCIDTGYALPGQLGFSLSGSTLHGDASVDNLQFLNGLGVTGVGEFPGVFIAAPTDILNGDFRIQRHRAEAQLIFSQPIFVAWDGIIGPAIGANGFRPGGRGDAPSLSTISVIGGLRLGSIDQQENSSFWNDSPAFGINSAWNAAYDTDFDSKYYGVTVGVANAKTYFLQNGAAETWRFGGSLGYTHYDTDVRDRVSATGLGGALNYNSSATNSYSEGQFEAGLSGSYTYAKDNQSWTFFASADYGSVPYFDYRRPDSNLAGALDPTLSLEPRVTYTIGFNWGLRF